MPRYQQRDNPEFCAMLTRMIAAYGRRVGEGDTVDLTMLAQLQGPLDRALQLAVTAQRATGTSWSQIGDALGISKQAAAKRFGLSE